MIDFDFLSIDRVSGRLICALALLLYVGGTLTACTLVGWPTGLACAIFCTAFFGVPVASIVIPLIWALISWVWKGRADYLWLSMGSYGRFVL
jgi:hypothetical protein